MIERYRYPVYDPFGARRGWLTHAGEISWSSTFSETSSMQLTHLDGKPGADLLYTFCEVAVEWSTDGVTWTEPPNGRWLRIKRGRKPSGSAKSRSYTMPGYGYLLTKMLNLEYANGLVVNEEGKVPFSAASVGKIIKFFYDRYITRTLGTSALGSQVLIDFTDTVDSAGNAWNRNLTIEFDPGVSIYQILDSLTQQGMCEWYFQGRTLRVFNAGSLGATRPVTMQFGVDIAAMPLEGDLDDLRHRVLVLGEGWANQIMESGYSPPAPWSDFEEYVGASGVKDSGTKTILGDQVLFAGSRERVQYSLEIATKKTNYEPFRDYAPGNYITTPDEFGVDQLQRVRQINVARKADGEITITLIVNDRFVEKEIARAKKLNALSPGTPGGSGNVPNPPPATGRKPKTPTGVTLGSTAVNNEAGFTRAIAIVDWANVTQDVNNVDLDIDYYEVRAYKGSETDDQSWGTSATSILTKTALDPGSTWSVQVRAVSAANVRSAWSAKVTAVMESDTTPPATPSAPSVSSALGTVTVRWNGLTAGGAAMPPDFDRVEVYQQGVATRIDTLSTGGYSTIGGLTPGSTYAYAFRAVDHSGNASAMTGYTSVTVVSAATDAGIQAQLTALRGDVQSDIATTSQKSADGKNKIIYSGLAPVFNDFTTTTGLTAGGSATNTLDTAWFKTSPSSIRCTSTGSNASAVYPHGNVGSGQSAGRMGVTLGVERVYTTQCWAKLTNVQGGTPSSAARRIVVSAVAADGSTLTLGQSNALPNTAGAEAFLSVTYTVPVGVTDVYVRLINGSAVSGDYVNFDDYATTPGAGNLMPSDTWFRRGSGGLVIGQWEWDGSAFQAKTVDGQMVANLDAGRITVGQLDGLRIKAGTIRTTSLAVGQDENYVVDPAMADTALNALRTANSPAGWTAQTGKWVGTTGSSRLMLTGDATLPSGLDAINADGIKVKPGDKILMSATFKTSIASQCYIQLRTYDAAGAQIAWVWPTGNPITTVANTATVVSGVYTIPSGVYYVAPAALANTAGTYSIEISEMVFSKQTPSVLIADGAITAPKILADAVTANAIAAGSLDAYIITGATIRTAATGSRVELTSQGIRLFRGTVLKAWMNPTTGQIRFYSEGDITHTSTGHALQLGDDDGPNLALDTNEVMGRTAGDYGLLRLNGEGGQVLIGGIKGGFVGDTRSYPAGGNHLISLRGTVLISNTSDGGYADEEPPLMIGIASGQHLWFDSNEMGSSVGDGVGRIFINPPREAPNAAGDTHHTEVVVLASSSLGVQRYGDYAAGTRSTFLFGYDGGCDLGLRYSGNQDRIYVTSRDAQTAKIISAASFATTSAQASKHKIGKVTGALDAVLNAPSKRWQYRDDVEKAPRWHIGPMFEDLPADVQIPGDPDGEGAVEVHGSVDTASMIGLLWAAVIELAAKIER